MVGPIQSRARTFAAVLLAAAGLIGCGGDEPEEESPRGLSGAIGATGASGATGSEGPAITGADLDCPFTLEEIRSVIGRAAVERAPREAAFGRGSTCEFDNPVRREYSVSFGPIGDDPRALEETYLGYAEDVEREEEGVSITERPEWGLNAFILSHSAAEIDAAVAFFLSDGIPVGVSVGVPEAEDAADVAEELTEIVGPDGE